MDEQAGPGVFFNNNNNSVLPGGAKAPQPGDGGETARAQYSIPGILHFLQHEWARFEVERAQWEVERAELQVTRLLWPLFSEVFWTLCAKSHNQTFVGLFFSRWRYTRARAHTTLYIQRSSTKTWVSLLCTVTRSFFSTARDLRSLLRLKRTGKISFLNLAMKYWPGCVLDRNSACTFFKFLTCTAILKKTFM